MNFDAELYKCKAVLFEDDKTIVYGYYSRIDGHNFIDGVAINPYTLCRNTGVPIKTGGYLYEWDLIEYKTGVTDWEMGFIEWDEYNKCYSIRTSLNYSSKRNIRGIEIRVIGNVILNYSDMKRMQDYSNKEDANYISEPTAECRSTQYLNKRAKMFLPR